MNTSRNVAAAALVLALVGPSGCAGTESEAQEDVTSNNEQALQSTWGVLPTSADGTTAAMQSFNDVNIGPCRYTGVVFQVSEVNHTVAGILARQLPSPQICKPAGGNSSGGRFLGLVGYPSSNASARIVGPGPGGTLAFIGSGSLGPIAAAAGTTPALNIMLIRPLDGAVLRETTQGVCAPAAVANIQVGLWSFGSDGLLRIGGTKNGPTGLPGDGTCPSVAGAPFLQSYTLRYTGFGFGTGPVAQPTIQ